MSAKVSRPSSSLSSSPAAAKAVSGEELDALVERYKPKPSPDHALLAISKAYFNSRPFTMNAIDSMNQAYDAIARIVPSQYITTLYGKTSDGGRVEAKFWFDNIRYTPPDVVSTHDEYTPISPYVSMITETTYALRMTADFHAELRLVETKEDRQLQLKESIAFARHGIPRTFSKDLSKVPIVRVDEPDALKATLPLMVGARYCRVTALRKTPVEAYLLGEDPYTLGGYFSLKGKCKTVGGVFSHIPNSPMAVFSTLKGERVRCNLMTRKDPYFGNSYDMVSAVLEKEKEIKGEPGKTRLVHDVVFELTRNNIGYDMNPKETGGVRSYKNRIPIAAFFYYYGCHSQGEMANYIFPDVAETDQRMQFLQEVITSGHFHERFLYDEKGTPIPITREYALYYIGENNISDKYKALYREEIAADLDQIRAEFTPEELVGAVELRYQETIRRRMKEILDGSFFYNINQDPQKVCTVMGALVRQLICIHLGIEAEVNRNSTETRNIQAVGEQFVGEFKRFFGRSVTEPISKRIMEHLFNPMPWETMAEMFGFEVKAALGPLGTNLSRNMIRAFKSSAKAEERQPRLQEELRDPKNAIFELSKINEVTIRPTKGEKPHTVIFLRRLAEPSMAGFFCPDQTPEAGADVGRYDQPTIYVQLSLCHSEQPVRILLGMRDTSHPSVVGTAEEQKRIPPIWASLNLPADSPHMKRLLPMNLGAKTNETCATLFGFTEVLPKPSELSQYFKVYINGTLIGVVPRGYVSGKGNGKGNGARLRAMEMVEWLKEKRRDFLHPTTSISIDIPERTIHIYTDAGRPMIPLVPARWILDEKCNDEFRVFLRESIDRKEGREDEGGRADEGEVWEEMIRRGYVELFDPKMAENTVVAQSIPDLLARRNECLHVMLPCGTTGLIVSLMTSAHMTKGSRVLYGCNYWKQGQGDTIHNLFTNYLNEINSLRQPQLPLVRSQFHSLIGIDAYPFCQNVLIAFMPCADNQADSLTIDQGAVDRGLFEAIHTHTHVFKPEKVNVSFGVPADLTQVTNLKGSIESYRKVDPIYGTPTRIGALFGYKDIIAAETGPAVEGETTKLTDYSEVMDKDHCPDDRHPSPARGTAYYKNVGQNERVRILQFESNRMCKDGDKFASQGNQKGVIGSVYPEWMMPYTEDGLRPNFIFNTPAAVRRETYGQMRDAVLGLIAAYLGSSIDATSFITTPRFTPTFSPPTGFSGKGPVTIKPPTSSADLPDGALKGFDLSESYTFLERCTKGEDERKSEFARLTGGTVEETLSSGIYMPEITKILTGLGLDDKGTRTMYNPVTGRAYECQIFFGVLPYMRQKRMVDDLRQERAGGRRDMYSHMPTQGKGNDGGMKLGEMERMAEQASGAMNVHNDMIGPRCAISDINICNRCGIPCYPSPMSPQLYQCDRDKTLDPGIMHHMKAPYSLSLLSSTLLGCGIELITRTSSSSIKE